MRLKRCRTTSSATARCRSSSAGISSGEGGGGGWKVPPQAARESAERLTRKVHRRSTTRGPGAPIELIRRPSPPRGPAARELFALGPHPRRPQAEMAPVATPRSGPRIVGVDHAVRKCDDRGHRLLGYRSPRSGAQGRLTPTVGAKLHLHDLGRHRQHRHLDRDLPGPPPRRRPSPEGRGTAGVLTRYLPERVGSIPHVTT